VRARIACSGDWRMLSGMNHSVMACIDIGFPSKDVPDGSALIFKDLSFGRLEGDFKTNV
jgi:hypothetical protein